MGRALQLGAGLGLVVSAAALATSPACAAPDQAQTLALLNRVTWGATPSSAAEIEAMGPDRWLAKQLHPGADDPLPPAVQAQIDALPISTQPMAALVVDLDAQNKAANALIDPDQKKAAQQAYQQAMTATAKQAATRDILRDLYSPDQLKEQMTWFWFNHFNVHEYKANIRPMIGDYIDRAIPPTPWAGSATCSRRR